MIYRVCFACLAVALLFVNGFAQAGEKYLEMGAKEWKYMDSAEGLAKEWNKVEFDDSGWKSGQAPLGYGDDDIKQKISYGDDEENKRICAFFRRTIEVEDPAAIKKVVGKLNCDDGCAIYVNGEEVYRFNLPKGEIKNDTTAKFTMGGELERYAMTFLIDAAKFKAGKNVIAVRVHQGGASSSDMAIDVSLEGLTDEEAIKSAQQQFEEEQAAIEELSEEGGF